MAKILVVDDDVLVNDMMVRFLSRHGHESLGVYDGSMVAGAMKEFICDLIITDLVMPIQEGLETIQAIRKVRKDLPIIAISGGGRVGPENYLEVAKQLGAKFAFTKPIKLSALLAAVEECVGGVSA